MLEILSVNSTSLDLVDRAWGRFWRGAVTAEALAESVVPVEAATCSSSAKKTLLISAI